MGKTCPISSHKINSSLVRIFSFEISLIVLLLVITKEPIYAYVLLFDFITDVTHPKHTLIKQ